MPIEGGDGVPRLATLAANSTISDHAEMRRGKKLITSPGDIGRDSAMTFDVNFLIAIVSMLFQTLGGNSLQASIRVQ